MPFLFWRSGKPQRFCRGSEMHFTQTIQELISADCCQFRRGLIDLETGAAGKSAAAQFPQKMEPADEFRTRKNGGRRDGNIGFCSGFLFEPDGPAFFHKGVPYQGFVTEFI